MKQLTALDASFLGIDSDRNYGHTGGLAILDPSTAGEGATLTGVKQLVADRLHLVPPFTSRLARVPLDLDWPYWVPDDHFDLGYHCRELALPAPGSMEQLIEQAARIYSRRLDRSRPLWELYVIHGLQGGRIAVLTKVHHAAVDGMSGAEIMTMLYDVSPEPRTVEPPSDVVESVDGPGSTELLLRAARSLPGAPLRTGRRVGQLLPHADVIPSVLGVPGTALVSRAFSRARRGQSKVLVRPRIRPAKGVYDGKLSPHRIFGLGSLSLDSAKRVKNHFGVKVNDVVLAVTAGALREHLLRHQQLPSDPLVAQVPISVRTDEERGTFGNQVSVVFVPIPTQLDDPVRRIRFAAQTMDAAKERHGALPAKALQDVTQFVPPAVHARAARTMAELTPRLGLLPFNVIISNVPGPPVDIYSAGARLEALYPLSIISDGAALNITLMSYRDQIDFAITADRELTPDVQTIADRMPVELEELVSLT